MIKLNFFDSIKIGEDVPQREDRFDRAGDLHVSIPHYYPEDRLLAGLIRCGTLSQNGEYTGEIGHSWWPIFDARCVPEVAQRMHMLLHTELAEKSVLLDLFLVLFHSVEGCMRLYLCGSSVLQILGEEGVRAGWAHFLGVHLVEGDLPIPSDLFAFRDRDFRIVVPEQVNFPGVHRKKVACDAYRYLCALFQHAPTNAVDQPIEFEQKGTCYEMMKVTLASGAVFEFIFISQYEGDRWSIQHRSVSSWDDLQFEITGYFGRQPVIAGIHDAFSAEQCLADLLVRNYRPTYLSPFSWLRFVRKHCRIVDPEQEENMVRHLTSDEHWERRLCTMIGKDLKKLGILTQPVGKSDLPELVSYLMRAASSLLRHQAPGQTSCFFSVCWTALGLHGVRLDASDGVSASGRVASALVHAHVPLRVVLAILGLLHGCFVPQQLTWHAGRVFFRVSSPVRCLISADILEHALVLQGYFAQGPSEDENSALCAMIGDFILAHHDQVILPRSMNVEDLSRMMHAVREQCFVPRDACETWIERVSPQIILGWLFSFLFGISHDSRLSWAVGAYQFFLCAGDKGLRIWRNHAIGSMPLLPPSSLDFFRDNGEHRWTTLFLEAHAPCSLLLKLWNGGHTQEETFLLFRHLLDKEIAWVQALRLDPSPEVQEIFVEWLLKQDSFSTEAERLFQSFYLPEQVQVETANLWMQVVRKLYLGGHVRWGDRILETLLSNLKKGGSAQRRDLFGLIALRARDQGSSNKLVDRWIVRVCGRKGMQNPQEWELFLKAFMAMIAFPSERRTAMSALSTVVAGSESHSSYEMELFQGLESVCNFPDDLGLVRIHWDLLWAFNSARVKFREGTRCKRAYVQWVVRLLILSVESTTGRWRVRVEHQGEVCKWIKIQAPKWRLLGWIEPKSNRELMWISEAIEELNATRKELEQFPQEFLAMGLEWHLTQPMLNKDRVEMLMEMLLRSDAALVWRMVRDRARSKALLASVVLSLGEHIDRKVAHFFFQLDPETLPDLVPLLAKIAMEQSTSVANRYLDNYLQKNFSLERWIEWFLDRPDRVLEAETWQALWVRIAAAPPVVEMLCLVWERFVRSVRADGLQVDCSGIRLAIQCALDHSLDSLLLLEGCEQLVCEHATREQAATVAIELWKIVLWKDQDVTEERCWGVYATWAHELQRMHKGALERWHQKMERVLFVPEQGVSQKIWRLRLRWHEKNFQQEGASERLCVLLRTAASNVEGDLHIRLRDLFVQQEPLLGIAECTQIWTAIFQWEWPLFEHLVWDQVATEKFANMVAFCEQTSDWNALKWICSGFAGVIGERITRAEQSSWGGLFSQWSTAVYPMYAHNESQDHWTAFLRSFKVLFRKILHDGSGASEATQKLCCLFDQILTFEKGKGPNAATLRRFAEVHCVWMSALREEPDLEAMHELLRRYFGHIGVSTDPEALHFLIAGLSGWVMQQQPHNPHVPTPYPRPLYCDTPLLDTIKVLVAAQDELFFVQQVFFLYELASIELWTGVSLGRDQTSTMAQLPPSVRLFVIHGFIQALLPRGDSPSFTRAVEIIAQESQWSYHSDLLLELGEQLVMTLEAHPPYEHEIVHVGNGYDASGGTILWALVEKTLLRTHRWVIPLGPLKVWYHRIFKCAKRGASHFLGMIDQQRTLKSPAREDVGGLSLIAARYLELQAVLVCSLPEERAGLVDNLQRSILRFYRQLVGLNRSGESDVTETLTRSLVAVWNRVGCENPGRNIDALAAYLRECWKIFPQEPRFRRERRAILSACCAYLKTVSGDQQSLSHSWQEVVDILHSGLVEMRESGDPEEKFMFSLECALLRENTLFCTTASPEHIKKAHCEAYLADWNSVLKTFDFQQIDITKIAPGGSHNYFQMFFRDAQRFILRRFDRSDTAVTRAVSMTLLRLIDVDRLPQTQQLVGVCYHVHSLRLYLDDKIEWVLKELRLITHVTRLFQRWKNQEELDVFVRDCAALAVSFHQLNIDLRWMREQKELLERFVITMGKAPTSMHGHVVGVIFRRLVLCGLALEEDNDRALFVQDLFRIVERAITPECAPSFLRHCLALGRILKESCQTIRPFGVIKIVLYDVDADVRVGAVVLFVGSSLDPTLSVDFEVRGNGPELSDMLDQFDLGHLKFHRSPH